MLLYFLPYLNVSYLIALFKNVTLEAALYAYDFFFNIFAMQVSNKRLY